MAKLMRKWVKTAKRRIKAGLQDLRTWRLYMAGRELLAERDIDDIKVVELCKMAGLSVGAFYGRFPTKAAFLSFLIRERLGQARDAAERDLSLERAGPTSLESRAAFMVEHQLKALHGPMGGVVRACFKSGGKDLAELRVYRDAVSDQAVLLLCSELGATMQRDVQAAVQMLHASLIDMLIHEDGALRRGRRQTVEALTQALQGYLGLGIMDVDTDPLRGDEIILMTDEFGPRPVEGEALRQLIETEAAAKLSRQTPTATKVQQKPARAAKPKARTYTRHLRAKLV
jgi:AcrR family transcriptional regulator